MAMSSDGRYAIIANHSWRHVKFKKLQLPDGPQTNSDLTPEILKQLEDDDLIALKYVDNPNGSVSDIAGITNKKGNVLGLMPHPERSCDPLIGSTDGLFIMKNLLS